MKRILLGQFEAALAMVNECVAACPDGCWDTPIAKYPFWQVAYHTLCFVDCYLSPGNGAFAAELAERAAAGGFAAGLHPKGMAELEEEYPSRRFGREELLGYAELCLAKLRRTLGEGSGSETEEVLHGPSGFPWLPFSRAEAHLYNIRHVQHHAGQLGAALRKSGVEGLPWVRHGWRSPPQ